LPLCKGYASEKVYELLAVSLQCFGGSGYCSDYPIEQYIRDQKIDTLYEGTTHIQALDLFFRKVGRDRGAALQALFADIGKDLAALPPELAVEAKAVKAALDDVGAIFMGMLGKLAQSPYHVGLHGNRILFALAELIIGWRLAGERPRSRWPPRPAPPSATGRSTPARSRRRASSRARCCRRSPRRARSSRAATWA
jgi:hypothetical protein